MKFRTLLLCLTAVLLAGLAAFMFWPGADSPDDVAGRKGNPGTSGAGGGGAAAAEGGAGAEKSGESGSKSRPRIASLSPAAQKIHDAILDVLDELKSGDPARRKAALDRIDELLGGEGHDAAASIAAILEFLKSGLDAETGEEFSVGENGLLAASNSLRVFLLDQLGTLCVEANSPAAVAVARDILSRFGSPDEWAVCMRNVAWLDPQNTAYLSAKAGEMLGHPDWQEKPTRGYLEAFDIVVHSGASDLIPRLENFLTKAEDNPLWRASAVALDRLAQTRPEAILQWMNNNPDALRDRPGQRADLFAKADLGNPTQRALVETYLGRADVSADEKGSCLGGLVAPGAFLSNNLVTRPPQPPTPEAERERLNMLNRVGREWLGGNRFPDLNQHLGDFVNNTNPPQEQ